MVETKQTTEEVKPKQRFELAEVPTQTGIYIIDTETKEALEDKAVLLRILNGIESLKKSLG